MNIPIGVKTILFIALWSLSGCRAQPEQIKESAIANVEAARAVGAEQYLSDEFRVLKNSLNLALRNLEFENERPAHQRNYTFVAEQLKWVSANASVLIENTELRKAEVRIEAGERLTSLTKTIEQNRRFLANHTHSDQNKTALEELSIQINLLDSAVVKINSLINNGHYLDALSAVIETNKLTLKLPFN